MPAIKEAPGATEHLTRGRNEGEWADVPGKDGGHLGDLEKDWPEAAQQAKTVTACLKVVHGER